ncbi:MAG TPA: glucoamylase family protein [Chitinophagaceae bacterium]|nr:glucoamylase family protein [Chitinophagaceae bacterium]
MKVTTSTVSDILSHLRLNFLSDNSLRKHSEEPFRSELFSSDQMDRHGKVLAKSHKLQKGFSFDKLLKRLEDNERTLLEVRNLLVESLRADKTITPASEWLLDNFYLVEEQVVIARKHLPKGYSEALPYLTEGVSAGMPRVYDIVLEIIAHSDGRVDVNSLTSFIASYQNETILTLGELWAIPIMLRLAVIENLRRIAGKIALDVIDHNLADHWADKMIATIKEKPADLILVIADMARSKPILDSHFVATFTRKIQGIGPSLALPLNWIEQQLAALGTSSNDLVLQENQRQAIDQVSVRNSIGTLRFIGATDWREFVETLSSVEQVLRHDKTGTYPLMDFATRDSYRHVVERISKSCDLSETVVAQKAIELAHQNKSDDLSAKRKEHVGYYLIDKGLEETEHACGMRYTLRVKINRVAAKMPNFIYIFSIFFLAFVFTAGLFYIAYNYASHSWQLLTVVGSLSFLGSLQLAISFVNWLSTVLVLPQLLPRMDYSNGIPTECRSLVVVPTMLTSEAYIEELIEGLEIRYLANKEDNLHFGLLTDFMDADSATMPGDDQLVALAKKRIDELNEKYTSPESNTFYLFHRPRAWNPREKKWMGYERKRGKLSALNALLRERGRNDFSLVVGDLHILTNIKYVITLDSDTQLPRESVWKFIGNMAHPLNHPVYDPNIKRVINGYGILQPRVEPSIPKTAVTLYLRMQGNLSGIDPYTKASSDVYQDLFGQGSFIGKGIYEVDVFEQVLDNRFPENRILSHDLLEGCFVRSGLISDVHLYEESPSRYKTDVERHHRWTRGDWQIAAWMFPFAQDSKGHLTKNRLSGLSRWKIFDNLRRSVTPLALTLLLLLGWCVLPLSWFWTAVVTIIVLLPLMAAAAWQLINKPDDITITSHFIEVGISVKNFLIRFVFGLAVLPHEAYKNIDAIVRTIWRLNVSHRKLLQWVPSAATNRFGTNSLLTVYTGMWIAPLLSILTIASIIYFNAAALFVASPILLLWLFAPAIAWYLSKEEKQKKPNLSESQQLFLHKTARRTWAFFEQFVNAEENWLPPDNFQEQPAPVIAHRTSPTNIGLALLANLAAYDFGYISGKEMAERCNSTLGTMRKMERYDGHFYNWYDTLSLLPLHPKYVSTVDSGNLIGHLLTLRQGLFSQVNEPVFKKSSYNGLLTTLKIIQEYPGKQAEEDTQKIITLLSAALADNNNSLSSAKKYFDEVSVLIDDLSSIPGNTESKKWISKLSSQLKKVYDDLLELVPWIYLLPVPGNFERLNALDTIPSLRTIVDQSQFLEAINFYQQNDDTNDEWLTKMHECILKATTVATERIRLLDELAQQCEKFSEVEYDFLFEPSTNLLRIGYNVDEQRKDNSYYDLLASEARLGIFVAISQGKLPQESWFALGRLLTNSGGEPILLSWSGSMFEYLMPQLIMPIYENTLLYQTNIATVNRQIEYAEQRNVPWGISESGYNSVDAHMNYQYRAFGVPGLGLKRGLEEDIVIAPYASMLALTVAPVKACKNLQLLSKHFATGEYGFYEAIDYTPSRVPRGSAYSIVRSYMVHHQGMSFLSLAHVLLDKPMQQRFESELRFNASLLLLQERIPRTTLFYAHTADIIETPMAATDVEIRSINTPNTRLPEIQLLSNGHYQVMVTNSGGGYSRWKNIAVTRWREDATKDDLGIFCYIKDVNSGKFWSNTHQPTLQTARSYEAIFSQGHVEFKRNDFGIDTKTEVVISPEDDTELRRIRITNRTQSAKVLDITSYAEVVMATQASDEAHPAFSNLFVQTKIIREHNTIYCTRRPRSEEERPPWMFHLMHVHGAEVEDTSFETDRMQFIGRGRTLKHPRAIDNDVLSGNEGSVLDPVMAIRYRILIKANQSATVDLIYGIAETKDACENLMAKYQDRNLKNRAFELSWTHSQVLLRQINATEADAQLFNRLATSIIYSNSNLRADAAVIQNNYRGQSGLWSHSVSGDLPIVLLHIYEQESVELVKQMVKAHAYWRLKGLSVDLVIWNEDHGSYRQFLQEQILGLVTAEANIPGQQRPGGIFVKSADQLSSEDRLLFESVARIIISDIKGSLLEQVTAQVADKPLAALLETKAIPSQLQQPDIALPNDLMFFNGTGGFTQNGKEYKILIDKNRTTPLPWVNVIANPQFGSVVSENGSAYTWAINAHEYRITPWSNDPVSDIGGEAFYLRDEDTGYFWCPTPFPKKGIGPYITTHGFGYSIFEHSEDGIHSEMSVFVDKDQPVKFVVLKVKNESGRIRTLSAMGFLEIILGDVRSKTNIHVFSEQDKNTGALMFRNRYNSAFGERVSYFKVEGGYNFSYTADRSEFIGRNRDLSNPQALYRKKLSGRTGAAMDPCAALHVKFDLLSGGEKEIIFQVGNEKNAGAAAALLQQFINRDTVLQSLQTVKEYWQKIINTVQVTTPDTALNYLANGWLTYQTIACRMFARSGFYQSGGAFGFRDQLQDVLALLHTQPAMAREQILLSASRQFVEGDVQHWWHPPEGRGVRTRCSDDLLWLPFVVSRYINVTGDSDILQAQIGFLESRTLYEGEDSLYDLPVTLNASGNLYEHCVRAIKYSHRFGKHGLPLIGAGDWNDGMDRVGDKGKGESIWLAFFLYDVLIKFSNIATSNGDSLFAESCKKDAATLQSNIERSGWDGEWYRRAYFDDGSPLGSKENTECRIDAIAQSWSVLSGAASDERKMMAMRSLDKYLVKRDLKIIQLLDPPFDANGPNPGYIRGYVPGVRENGGQYSHAAIWTLMAFAALRDREKVWELFSMIQPLGHASDPQKTKVYKVEPYVIAADVYANESHRGRGGWTWYTGSAGWMYQFIMSSMIGIELKKDQLQFNPCFPIEWPSIKIQYKYGRSTYRFIVYQFKGNEGSWWKSEAGEGKGNAIQLIDDGLEHRFEVHVRS